ncbi:MAG: HypC/HybG/HupF family hydrogenase formation chaperone [Nocardioidaceae bacterium]
MCLAVPGRVTEIAGGWGLPTATVECRGTQRECSLAYLPDATVGDYVLIHAGFAVTILDEASAAETLALFEEIESAPPRTRQ